MSINRTVVKTWVATVTLLNGQTVEIEVRAKTIKLGRELLKQDSNIKSIIRFRKP